MFSETTTKAIAFFTLCFLGAAPLFGQGCPNHQALLDKMDEIFEAHAVDRLGEIYHVDAVIHSPEGTQEGLDKIVEQAKQFHAMVPDAQGVNHDVFCNGADKLAVRWTGSGTSNGTKVNVQGITIYHTRDGKITEVWEEMNTMAMMMQMGYELKAPGQ